MGNVIYRTGDMLTSTMPAIGHGVNVYGVMGSGIAAVIKKVCPDIFDEYQKACHTNLLQPGGMLPIYSHQNQRWVLNLASQDKPGRNARIDWLGHSVIAAYEFANKQGLKGFALPRIGAGIGGLKWEEVNAVINLIAPNYPNVDLEIWTLPDVKNVAS